MKLVSAVMFGFLAFFAATSMVVADDIKPPNDEIAQQVEERGEPQNLGAVQYNCTGPDWCDYSDPLDSWVTKYYEGQCKGGRPQAMECNTQDKNVDCSATSSDNSHYDECHCTNWETKQVHVQIRVQCWASD